jgi:oligoendopeptidase F
VNYVYSKLLAIRYFDLLQRDHAGFPTRYVSLLGNGYDAPPDALLRRFVGTTLGDPELIDGAVRVLESWLGELKSLYRD